MGVFWAWFGFNGTEGDQGGWMSAGGWLGAGTAVSAGEKTAQGKNEKEAKTGTERKRYNLEIIMLNNVIKD